MTTNDTMGKDKSMNTEMSTDANIVTGTAGISDFESAYHGAMEELRWHRRKLAHARRTALALKQDVFDGLQIGECNCVGCDSPINNAVKTNFDNLENQLRSYGA